METIAAIKANAARGYKTIEGLWRSFFRDHDIVVYEGSGATIVFGVKSLKTVFKMASIKNPDAFKFELYAIENAQFAHKIGFVYAAITEANEEMIKRIPRGLKAACKVGDPVVTMPLLSGTTVLEALSSRKVDPQIIARSIVDHVAKLNEHDWYNTDVKLENIQLTDDGRIVFLDWGSLCQKEKMHPTATYMLEGKTSCPKACASVTAVIALTELFGMKVPFDNVVQMETYQQLRGNVLEILEVPHNQRFAAVTIA